MTRGTRAFFAPEVVQTSAMDCGPAALKCVLDGHGIPVSYGRLREACQTDVDGTSIDALETVAQQLGLQSEQVMIPADHLLLPEAQALPAIVVFRQSDGATHFVVAWRRVGRRVQLMDPATGRRWLASPDIDRELFRHEHAVGADDWRAWAASDEFVAPLRRRLGALGATPAQADALLATATADPGWFGLGALDAAVRLADAVVRAGGLARGAAALRLVPALFERSRRSPDDIFRAIPSAYWSAVPDAASTEHTGLRLVLRGAVLLRLPGRLADAPRTRATAPLSAELAAALREKPVHPMRRVWAMLREDGVLAPLAMAGAIVLAAGALVVETLLFRGIFDIAAQLATPLQRLAALAALLVFAALLLALEFPLVREAMRHGRHLETRLRLALLAKLPRLPDRYFQSRSVSDMAERNHAIHLVRGVPQLGMNAIQASAELALTLAGIALIAPGSAAPAGAIALAAMLLPLAFQPMMNERDLRLRNHATALNGFYLDALLGLVPVRAHHAGRAVQRQHEGLLVEWARAGRGTLAASLASSGLQAALATGLAAWLLVSHFLRAGTVAGSDLLLVYWVLKMPALGRSLGGLARQYPAQRNALLRLLEPLAAPEEEPPARAAEPPPAHAGPATIAIDAGRVLAGGHEILRGLDLRIGAGEHVAVVGASGAGKSSLIGLLLGWHRLADGRLRVDGRALDAEAQAALRRQTAWVDPAVQLWNSPVLDNLAYASDDDATPRLAPVIEAADLRGVLQKLPEGLQTLLGEGGTRLSGGEGQRIRLGRAFAQTGVRLVLLDEPFRGLDRAQRGALLGDARCWWADRTLLCVTHDVGETLAFPRVLVVDGGRIVEDGAPHALAARDSHYARLLAAEGEVRRGLWQGAQWRRLRLADGRIAEGGP